MQGALEALTYIARNPCSSNEDIQSGIYQYAANILATEGELQYRRNAEMNQKQRQFNGARNDWDMQNMMKNSDYASMRGNESLFEFDGGPVAGQAQPQQRMPMREMVRAPKMRSGSGFDMSATATAADMGMGMRGTNIEEDIPMGNIAMPKGGNMHINPMRADSGISAPHMPQSYPAIPAGAHPVMNYPPVPSTNVQAPPAQAQQSGGANLGQGHSTENTDENGIPIF